MADGPGRGVAAAVGWAGLSLKYVDRTSSPRLGVSSCLPLLSRKTFGAPSLLRLPSRRTLGGRARHGYALSRQGREKLPMDVGPFPSAFLRLRFFYLSRIFNSRQKFPIFVPVHVLRNEKGVIDEVLPFNDDALDWSLNDWSF